jgi:hypothetical protein
MVKVKQSHNTPMEVQGERMYSFYSFMTSALDEGEWSALCPGHTLPRAEGLPVPIVQEAGWAPTADLETEARGKIICLCRGSNLKHPIV